MTEINGLNERIADLKRYYQEAERMNLKNNVGELLADINYLEELQELRSKQEFFIRAFDKIRAEIEKDAFTDVNNSKFISVNRINQIIDKYRAESEGV